MSWGWYVSKLPPYVIFRKKIIIIIIIIIIIVKTLFIQDST